MNASVARAVEAVFVVELMADTTNDFGDELAAAAAAMHMHFLPTLDSLDSDFEVAQVK